MNFGELPTGPWTTNHVMGPVTGPAVGTTVDGNSAAAQATDSTDSTQKASKPVDEAGEKLAAEMKIFNDLAASLKCKLITTGTLDERGASVVSLAAELFGVAPTWTAFYREVLGSEGFLRTAISEASEISEFECCDHHSKLLEMLTALRSRDLPENDPHEAQRMITVRIPKSLHDTICDEANRLEISVNKLCISRLLQRVDRSMIPNSNQKRRGRKPGTGAGKKVSKRTDAEPAIAEYRPLED
jgi:predicted HicB family RNase H-like nuclease